MSLTNVTAIAAALTASPASKGHVPGAASRAASAWPRRQRVNRIGELRDRSATVVLAQITALDEALNVGRPASVLVRDNFDE